MSALTNLAGLVFTSIFLPSSSPAAKRDLTESAIKLQNR